MAKKEIAYSEGILILTARKYYHFYGWYYYCTSVVFYTDLVQYQIVRIRSVKSTSTYYYYNKL